MSYRHSKHARGKGLDFETAVEAVLHVMDGMRLMEAARRYDLTVGHLSLMANGARRIDVYTYASQVYHECRRRQELEMASLVSRSASSEYQHLSETSLPISQG